MWPWSKFRKLESQISYLKKENKVVGGRALDYRLAINKLKARVGSFMGVSGDSVMVGHEENLNFDRLAFKKAGLDEILKMIDDLP